MMILRTDRQDARSMQQYFFPFLTEYCKTNILNAGNDLEKKLIAKMITGVFDLVKERVDKKLCTHSENFKLKFTDAEGIVLYKLLTVLPLPDQQFYLIQLRQNTINHFHKLICEPV